MLKDRDYDVTSHIILILSLTLTQNERGGVGERLRGVVWRWSAKSARAHRSCWPRRSYLAHVKASYLLRVRNLELRVLKIAISSLSICRGSPCRWDLETS